MSDASKSYAYHKRNDLKGMCALAALVLREVLIYHGYTADVMEGRVDCIYHCWVALDNDTEADITATQFGKPPVYNPHKFDSPYYAGQIKNDIDYFYRNWAPDQRPTVNQVKRLVKLSLK